MKRKSYRVMFTMITTVKAENKNEARHMAGKKLCQMTPADMDCVVEEFIKLGE